jgi:transcriptional regulator with GAF, ATPase, and Fis domain
MGRSIRQASIKLRCSTTKVRNYVVVQRATGRDIGTTRANRGGGRPKQFHDSEIAGALAQTNGIQNDAARLLGCTKTVVNRYVRRQKAKAL